MLLELELHLASMPSEARRFLTTNPSVGPKSKYINSTITSPLKVYDPTDEVSTSNFQEL